VRRLMRTRLAGLTLENLPPGQWRQLRPGEIARLRRVAGLNGPSEPKSYGGG
jgi:16S rRNA U516 pseudouridylate synthase RsuA-like enzyme